METIMEPVSPSPVRPNRGIYSPSDLEHFKKSDAYKEINNFVRLCGDSVIGKKISDGDNTSEIIAKLEEFVGDCSRSIDNYPPIEQPMRFGNKAFRQWLAHVQDRAPYFIRSILPEEKHYAVEEISAYFGDSFGNERRIDYGTGHETNFVLFLLCLVKLRVVEEPDLCNLVLRVFVSYIKTMRRLQQIYLLEPAGSHGVWGLDDYHCLIYVWGAAQLVDHPEMTPRDVCDPNLVRAYADEYLYLEGIQTIYTVKSTAPFSETSPMLYSISELRDWRAVRNGMLKLYVGEVLDKLPVVQHLVFGNLLRCTWTPSAAASAPPAPSPPGGTNARVPPLPAAADSGRTHHVVNEVATKAPWTK